jgi:excisionase family DNA binding protein
MTKEITPAGLARRRGTSLDWIYRQIRAGKIPAVRRGRRLAIPVAALPKQERAAVAAGQ